MFNKSHSKMSKNAENNCRRATLSNLRAIIKNSENIREIIAEILENFFYKCEQTELNYFKEYEGMLIEMLSASPVIDKLVLVGRYDEAATLLRANYEKELRILYSLNIKSDLSFIKNLIVFPMKDISYTKMQNELKENLYGGLSKIAHSNYEKLSLPIGIAGNELKVICYQYIGKTQTEYNQKVAENLFRLNNTILIKAMHTYCDYLAKNQQIPLVEEVEKRGANKNVVKLIKKFNENFAKLSKHYEEVVK